MKLMVIGNGRSSHIRKWVRWYGKNDLEVVLLTKKTVEKGHYSGIDVKVLPEPNRYGFPGYWTLRTRRNRALVNRIILAERPDIVHVHQVNHRISTRIDHHPLVMSAWGSEIYQMKKGSRDEDIVRENLRIADLILGTTGEMVDELVGRFGAIRAKTDHFSWGVPLSVFRYESDKRKVKKEMGLPPDSMVFISPRGLTPIYRNDVILDAFGKAMNSTDNIFLVVIAKNVDGNVRKRYEGMIEELGIGSRVKMIWRSLPQKELAEMLTAADHYIGIPRSDQLSSMLLESMAAGCIPVVSDLAAYTGVIRDGENGFVVSGADPSELAKVMIEVARGHERFGGWRDDNRKYIEREQSWEAAGKKMLGHYDRLMKECGK